MLKVLLYSFIFSVSSYAHFLVTDYSLIEQLSKRLIKEEIILSRSFRSDRVISRFYLGRAQGHFYQLSEEGLIRRDYKSFEGQCYTLSFSSRIIAKKSRCVNQYNYKLLAHPEFREVNLASLVNTAEESILNYQKLTKSIKGFSFHYKNRYEYIDFENNHYPNLDDFRFSIESFASLKIEKSEFTLTQEIKYKQDAFHFYSEKENRVTYTLDVKERDVLFYDGKSKYLLYKRFQPRPLNFKVLELSDDYLEDYLANLDQLLFNINGNGVCFKDDHLRPTVYDCERLALNNKSYYKFSTFDLLLIDLEQKTYYALEK